LFVGSVCVVLLNVDKAGEEKENELVDDEWDVDASERESGGNWGSVGY
jgi:hypothetical protein